MTRNRTPARRPTRTEPAMIRGVIVAVLGLLTTLGASWAADVDKGTIATFAVGISVFLPLLQALWTRYAVTPNANVVAQVTPAGNVVTGEAARMTTGTPVPSPLGPLGRPVVQVEVDPRAVHVRRQHPQ